MLARFPLTLPPVSVLGSLVVDESAAPVVDAVWYMADMVNAGLTYTFPAGMLDGANWLTADLLLNGEECGVFVLEMQEGETGPVFQYLFALLPEATARLRLPLEAVRQNRWLYPREGALLKPRCAGQRVDLRRVDRMRVYVGMLGAAPVRWCMTPFVATEQEPLLLEQPGLPRGPLLDAFGQSTLRDWPGKTRSMDDLARRLQQQITEAPIQRWPSGFSKWGGWTGKSFVPTGYFYTQWDEDGQRWWLVDPDGYAFWSAGQDCVRPGIEANYSGMANALTELPEAATRRAEDGTQFVDYLKANFMRVFGADEWRDEWATITLAELRRAGFNTVGNWSDWQVASAAGFPYVRPLDGRALQASDLKRIYRELPDVFDPQFEADAAAFAQQLAETRDDPALIGYFMMNEPTWGFAQESPAAGMLFNTTACVSRLALADFLRERYGDDAALRAAWGIDATFDALAEGHWDTPLTPAATADLDDFSALLVAKYFSTLSAACKQVDPHHLNLGIRYHTVPPAWARMGMQSFDVFSMNCYQPQVAAADLEAIHELLHVPVMIGEWHFGALDVGLPATGVGNRVADQIARGQAYRWYVEQAAALPWCVGVHHFTHYDQSALGRFDGEAYNIGFYDIGNRPYEPLVQAARLSHERLYPVASGQLEPYANEPEWLPRFFF